MIDFASVRLWALCSHFILTTFLFWTRYQSIRMTLSSTQSDADYTAAENSYLALLSLGIFLLVMEFLMLPFNYNKLTFRAAIGVGLDAAACFFISWMVLDALAWQTYIYIFVFCVVVPSVWEFFAVLPVAYMRLRMTVVSAAGTSARGAMVVVRYLGQCANYLFEDCFGDMNAYANRPASPRGT